MIVITWGTLELRLELCYLQDFSPELLIFPCMAVVDRYYSDSHPHNANVAYQSNPHSLKITRLDFCNANVAATLKQMFFIKPVHIE
jgi:hypothetical protein